MARRLRRVPPSATLVLALVEMAAVYWLSSADRTIPGLTGILEDLLANTAHVPVYGLLGALLFHGLGGFEAAPAGAASGGEGPGSATSRGEGGAAMGARPALSILIASAYGLLDEWHQSFVPGRVGSGPDWVVDILAATLAVAAARRAARGEAVGDARTVGLLAAVLAAVGVSTVWGG